MLKNYKLWMIAFILICSGLNGYADNVAKIGDKDYETLADAINAATEGQTVEILVAGDYTIPSISKKITVKGDVDGVNYPIKAAYGCIADYAGVTFDNISFTLSGNENYCGFNWNTNETVTFKNCTFTNRLTTYGNQVFENCTFNQSDKDYVMWIYGKSTKFDGCTFNTVGKVFNVYNEGASDTYTLYVNDCTFNNSSNVYKPAILVKSLCKTKELYYNVYISGTNTLNGDWPSESSLYADGQLQNNGLYDVEGTGTGIKIYEESSQVYPVIAAVAQNVQTSEKYEDLQDAIYEATSNQTVKLLTDVDAGGGFFEIWYEDKSIDNITLDLNGHNISGSGNNGTLLSYVNAKITDSSDNPGTISNSYPTIFNIRNTLTIEKVNVTSNWYPVYNYQSTSNTVINSGNLTGAIGVYNNGGTVTVNGGTVTGTSSYGVQNDLGTLNVTGGTVTGYISGIGDGLTGQGKTVVNISGGTISSTAGYALSGNGSYNYSPEWNITGGTLTAADGHAAIYHPQNGTLNISGGTITGATGVQMCAGTLNVTGGTITGNGTDTRSQASGDGEIIDGAGISLVNRGYPGGTPSAYVENGRISSVLAYDWSGTTASEWTGATGFLTRKEAYTPVFTVSPDLTYVDPTYGVLPNDDPETMEAYPYMLGIPIPIWGIVYPGNEAGKYEITELHTFLAQQVKTPNAILVTTETYKEAAKQTTNVVVEYKTGYDGDNIYYECPEFVLTEPTELSSAYDFYTPVNFIALEGSYTRAFTADNSTCCVPFELSSAYLGSSAKLLTFAYYQYDDDYSWKIYFNANTSVVGGTPCFIYDPDQKGIHAEFNNTEIYATIDNSGNLKGTYAYTNNFSANGYYGISTSGNVLVPAVNYTVPFRSALALSYDERFNRGGSSAPAMKIVILDGNTTGINDVNANANAPKGIYTITGIKLNEITEPGIYIVDGKKVVVK